MSTKPNVRCIKIHSFVLFTKQMHLYTSTFLPTLRLLVAKQSNQFTEMMDNEKANFAAQRDAWNEERAGVCLFFLHRSNSFYRQWCPTQN